MARKIFLSASVLLLLLLGITEKTSWAAPPTIKWATPKRVPGYPAGTESPFLIADQNRTVHAFHSQPVNGVISIVYSQWTYERSWTMPVDILLPPRGEAQIKGVWLDAQGIFHLIFTAGNDQIGGNIYYSRAPAIDAGRASAWSPPQLIGKSANMFAAGLAGDNKGNLFVFYGGKLSGNGVYEIVSRDNGLTWSEPASIYLVAEEGLIPGTLALLMDTNAELHIAWSIWRPPFGAQDLYYARLNINSNQTTVPVLLSRNGADSPAMIKSGNNLLLVYATGSIAQGVAGKALQQSSDGGRTWSNAVWAFPPVVGGNGGAALVQDSKNNVHAFLGNRAGDCCHGLWYSVWEGNRWSDLQAIIQGPKSLDFDPFAPRAVVSQGNVILVTWWNESKSNGIWYTYAKLDTPELPVVALPTVAPTPTPRVVAPTETPPAVVPASPTPEAVATVASSVPVDLVQSPNLAIVVGVLPVMILIIVIVALRMRN